jgi:hypothetical protein
MTALPNASQALSTGMTVSQGGVTRIAATTGVVASVPQASVQIQGAPLIFPQGSTPALLTPPALGTAMHPGASGSGNTLPTFTQAQLLGQTVVNGFHFSHVQGNGAPQVQIIPRVQPSNVAPFTPHGVITPGGSIPLNPVPGQFQQPPMTFPLQAPNAQVPINPNFAQGFHQVPPPVSYGNFQPQFNFQIGHILSQLPQDPNLPPGFQPNHFQFT